MTNCIAVLVTAKNIQEGKKIARHLLGQKLVACANVLSHVQSMYWWRGKINQSREVLLVLKTKKSLFGRLMKEVKAVHSYQVPEIIALPIVEGSKDYLQWIKENVC